MGAPHEARPEDHLWGPRNDFKGEYYLSSNAHFVSEIGYHGCPNLETMKQISEDNPLFSEEMRLNMVNIDNPGKIADFITSILNVDRDKQ